MNIQPATKFDYQKNLRRLAPFFGELALADIHIGHLQEYRAERMKAAGASRINHEMSTVQQILKRAGLWQNIGAWYEPLPLPRQGPGIALEQDDETRLFKVASSNPRWKVAYCCALITANTTAGPEEVRLLQLKDVTLQDRMIYVRDGAKNKFRVRALPLNDDALWAVLQLVERARDRGAVAPDHYLLPHRGHGDGHADPTHPMDSWKKAWYALRTAAGLPNLRRYDLRHHAITRLLENPEVSEQTIKDIAGHVSKRILETYSHIRMRAKREAVGVLNSRHAPKPAEVVEIPAEKKRAVASK